MATVQYLLPLGLIIFMVIGFIFLGVATLPKKQRLREHWVIYLSHRLQAFELGYHQEGRHGYVKVR